MASLLDSGFLYALVDSSDAHHEKVLQVMQNQRESLVLPIPVITETAYLVKRANGSEQLAQFLDGLSDAAYLFETPTAQDYKRSAEIIRQYDDANIDFVDALIVAISERLLITKILTVDARHFRMFRPAHCRAFEILP